MTAFAVLDTDKIKGRENNMKNQNKILALLIVLLTITSAIPLAAAYDASTPYTATMSFYVPSDSTFSVDLAGSETDIQFHPAGKSSTSVEPQGQTASTSVAMAVITNDGNANMDFGVNLTASKPSWVTLTVSGDNLKANGVTFDVTNVQETEWLTVAPAGTANVYLWADFSNAVANTPPTNDRTFQINAELS